MLLSQLGCLATTDISNLYLFFNESNVIRTWYTRHRRGSNSAMWSGSTKRPRCWQSLNARHVGSQAPDPPGSGLLCSVLMCSRSSYTSCVLACQRTSVLFYMFPTMRLFSVWSSLALLTCCASALLNKPSPDAPAKARLPDRPSIYRSSEVYVDESISRSEPTLRRRGGSKRPKFDPGDADQPPSLPSIRPLRPPPKRPTNEEMDQRVQAAIFHSHSRNDQKPGRGSLPHLHGAS